MIIITAHQYLSNNKNPQNQNRPHTPPIIKNKLKQPVYKKQTTDTRHKTRHDHINKVQIPKTTFSPTSKLQTHPPNIKPITSNPKPDSKIRQWKTASDVRQNKRYRQL